MFTTTSLLALALMAQGVEPPFPLAEALRAEVEKIEARPLAGVDSADRWHAERPELRRRLLEMLGLWPLPERTPLNAKVTSTVVRPDFTIENLIFESRPGLYVTANLYRPAESDGKRPAVLYLCGHAGEEQDGVIYGNKAHYRHHAAWFAANGYVCLVLDTLQLGEVPGLHHGTYTEGMWWWQTRGYTPAGVEAWNAVRALDYLETLPDVDPTKIGVTGRSGGGATTWWVGAIDDRPAAVAPVAGITDLRDHVLGGDFPGPHQNGVVDGHCDCMYFVNFYRWDFDVVAALVAPKPLLVVNTDADPIFPLGGVKRVVEAARKVYEWEDAGDRIDLLVGSGGHVDTEEVRHPVYAFFERHLKGHEVEVADIKEPDRDFPIEVLRVLPVGEIPPDARNATIHETFVPRAEVPPVPETKEAWERLKASWLAEIRAKSLAGWPEGDDLASVEFDVVSDRTRDGLRWREFAYESMPGVPNRLWLLSSATGGDASELHLQLMTEEIAEEVEKLNEHFEDPEAGPFVGFEVYPKAIRDGSWIAFLEPRGSGSLAWEASEERSIRRRLALLGQTLDGMRAWDARRAVGAIRALDGLGSATVLLSAIPGQATVALMASAIDPINSKLVLGFPSPDLERGQAFLGLSRVLDAPQMLALVAAEDIKLITREGPEVWDWGRGIRRLVGTADGLRIIELSKPEP